jgi:GDP-4-dehydro-6-deoxy-D-mannose reductase
MHARASAPRVLVTGGGGFVGSWLVPLLESLGHATLGALKPGLPRPDFGAAWTECDLRSADDTRALLREARPDRIIHLAAVAFPPDALTDPFEALRLNYGAVDHLLCALVREAPKARLLYVSTGAVYAARSADAPPASEADPIAPGSLYAATKAAAERRVGLAVERDGVDAICARPFNHSGPGRPPLYVEASFAEQVARIERGEQEPVLRVGNLDAVRDFSDVRDVVRAYALLLDAGEPGATYNVCSGRGWSIRSLLDHLLQRSKVPARVERDPERYREEPADRLALVGDPSRIRELGWRPRYRFEETLDDLLDAYRAGG